MVPRRIIRTHDGQFEFLTQPDNIVSTVGLNNDENGFYSAFLIDSWVSLLADSPICPELPAAGKPKKVFRTFLQRLRKSLFETIAEFSSLADTLLRSGTLYGEGSTTGTWIDGMRHTPVFKEYLTYYRSGDAQTLRFLVTFLMFGKKAEFHRASLESDALCKWFEVEDRLSRLVLDTDITSDLAYLAKLLLQPVPSLPFLGRDGPGTVSGGGRSPHMKMNQHVYDPLLDRAFFLSVGHTATQERFAHDPSCVIEDDASWMRARDQKCKRALRPAELLFVPKSTTSMRSICREPAVLMYFQQALRYELEESISSSFLSHFVELRDQTKNQQACIAGSAYGLIDTLDLSSASDSVHVDLIKQVFPRHLLIKMLATRSTTVSIPSVNRTVRIHKFAPMGSAVCFPTQCIVYTLIGIRSYLVHVCGHEWRNIISDQRTLVRWWKKHVFDAPTPSIMKLQPLRVYGDDILCDGNVTEHISTTLESLGFVINREKSFTSSLAVRESCGTYAWNGEDITPLRFKVKHFERKATPKAVASLVDFANRAGDYHYRHLHSCIISQVLHMPLTGVMGHAKRGCSSTINGIPFTNDRNSWGLYTVRPIDQCNKHLHSRRYTGQVDDTTCSRYQRDEVWSLNTYTPCKSYHTWLDEKSYYIKWWRAAYLRGDSYSQDESASKYESTFRGILRWGWTPTQ